MAVDEELVTPGASPWRTAFTVGFLDGDSGREPATTTSSYLIGWKMGRLFARLRRPS